MSLLRGIGVGRAAGMGLFVGVGGSGDVCRGSASNDSIVDTERGLARGGCGFDGGVGGTLVSLLGGGTSAETKGGFSVEVLGFFGGTGLDTGLGVSSLLTASPPSTVAAVTGSCLLSLEDGFLGGWGLLNDNLGEILGASLVITSPTPICRRRER